MGLHDSGYKLLFSYPYLVECLIRGFVPGDWLGRLDFESLEPVSEGYPGDNLSMRYNDVVWRLRWRKSGSWIYVYLLLELQSRDEPLMAVRVLDYDGGLYRQIAKTVQPKSGDRLPIVLPVVLHHGHTRWKSPTEIYELIEPATPEIEPYLPHLRFLLLDAAAFPEDELEAMRNPVACLLWLEASRELKTAPIDELDKMLRSHEHFELRRAFALWLTQVFLPTRLPGVTVDEVKNLEEVSPMIAENAIDWSLKWREQGRREGRQEGRQEGEAALLIRLLTRRFGALSPAQIQHVEEADSEQRLAWGERLVTVESLDEVFAE